MLTADVVDAHVTLLAGGPDVVVTSDTDDLERLVASAGSAAAVRRC